MRVGSCKGPHKKATFERSIWIVWWFIDTKFSKYTCVLDYWSDITRLKYHNSYCGLKPSLIQCLFHRLVTSLICLTSKLNRYIIENMLSRAVDQCKTSQYYCPHQQCLFLTEVWVCFIAWAGVLIYHRCPMGHLGIGSNIAYSWYRLWMMEQIPHPLIPHCFPIKCYFYYLYVELHPLVWEGCTRRSSLL